MDGWGGVCKLLRIVYPLMIPQLCKKKMKTGFLCCSDLIYIMPANGSRVIVPGFMAGGEMKRLVLAVMESESSL